MMTTTMHGIINKVRGKVKGMAGVNLSPFFVIAGIVVLFLMFKNLFKVGGAIGNVFAAPGNSGRTDEVKSEIGGITIDPKATTKTEFQLKQIADAQFQAFNNNGWGIFGTDETLMFDSLNGCNSEDLKAVYKYFGVREQIVLFMPVFTADLFGWYGAELSGSDLARMKAIWSKTGMWS